MGGKKNSVKVSSKKVNEVLNALGGLYPNAHCELDYENSFQLLVATILSAQSTDKTVNKVTAGLFAKYGTPEDFLLMSQEQLEKEIKEIGLYRNKAKNILQMCRELIERYQSKVPDTMDELITLPGVGRKTANVVLSNAFGVPAIAVDTHVFRVANRIGLASSSSVEVAEEQLMENLPEDKWSQAHHLLIWHGRRVCAARKPKCGICPLNNCCKFFLSGLK